jgi:rod shape-determining protein MreD
VRPLGAFLWLAFVALLLRSTALSSLAARGFVLDALAFTTVIWALRHGDAWGASFGFTLGLMADLDAARWLGRHALLLALVGYAVGRLSSTLVRESARTQFALLAAATLVHQVWSASFELGGGPAAAPWLIGQAIFGSLFTATVGTALLVVARRLSGRPLFGYASGSAAQG